ncbi:MAG: N-acetylmuramoyl-L-alanine amidase [candidate division Zixibacteria bacterium]|nr:N-acetylmuramoyl-L-alanine amidase [candidate division Zixibacteria bacterium]
MQIFKTLLVSILLVIYFGNNGVAKVPTISVIYPKLNDHIGAVDSTFILGSVSAGSALVINGVKVSVHKDGGFIAFLPISPGRFEFNLVAKKGADSANLLWPVNVPVPRKSLDSINLQIVDDKDKSNNQVLTSGDFLFVDFWGTPGCSAFFSIPDLIDSMPMTEMPPQVQSFWGNFLFGGGVIPDSLRVRGYYRGFLPITCQRLPDSSRIFYHLVSSDMEQAIRQIQNNKTDFNILSLLKLRDRSKKDSSNYFISLNPSAWPRMVEFMDSVQIIRVGPQKGYLSISQPKGITALAVGSKGEWLKLKLSQTQYGWVNRNSIRFMEIGQPPEISYIKSLRTYSFSDNLSIEIPLSARHPFRIEEEDPYTIVLYLFGVNSDTDWIRYDFKDTTLEIATWSQVEPELYSLRLHFKERIWGYDAFYDNFILKFQINKHPQDIASLRNKIIVVDPGHSTDPGAVGPTGLKESEVNLKIAQALKKELEKKGARVILTRNDMSSLPLNDRPVIARQNKADIFVSIHNNALPDGVNPFANNGISTYYYHPHSIELARAIQEQLLKGTGLNDYGLYYGNLAVDRPTQYPAVLVECAFIMLPEQEVLLKTEQFRTKLAKGIGNGIEKFLKGYEQR